METLTNATPTAGETPRASLTAHTMLWDSVRPSIDEVVPVLDFRPDAVLGRVPARTVDGRDAAVLGVAADRVYVVL